MLEEGRIDALRAGAEAVLGRSLDRWIDKKLSGDERAQAERLLAKDRLGADAIALRSALAARDAARALRLLARHGRAMIEAFSALGGPSLSVALARLDRGNAVAARGLLEGQGAVFAAGAVWADLQNGRAGAKQAALRLRAHPVAERQTIAAEFERAFGVTLEQRLGAKLKSAALARRVLGCEWTLADEAELALAPPADLEAFRAVFAARSRGEAAEVDAAYRARHGYGLSAAVERQFKGLSRRVALDALLGEPATRDELVRRTEALWANERSGARNALSKLLLDHLLRTSHGRRADTHMEALRARGDADMAAYVRGDLRSFQIARAKTADIVAGVGATAAVTAATVVTGGALAPAAAAALHGAAAGMGRFALRGAIDPSRVGASQLFSDVSIGVAAGVGAAIAAQGVAALAEVTREQMGAGFRRFYGIDVADSATHSAIASEFMLGVTPYGQLAAMTVKGGLIGAGAGAARQAAEALFQARVRGLSGVSALKLATKSAARGAGLGLLVGGGTGALMSALGAAEFSFLSQEERARLVHPLDFRAPDGTLHRIEIVGDVSPEYLRWIEQELSALSAKTGGIGVQGIRGIYVLDLGPEVAGLAGPGDAIALEPTYDGSTLAHEAGHIADYDFGSVLHELSSPAHGPFGRPPFISDYASTDAHEDFAETHESLISNWDEILADPARYLDPSYQGGLGAKYRFIMEKVYAERLTEALGR